VKESIQYELFELPKKRSRISAVTFVEMSEEERKIFFSYIHKHLDVSGDGHYHYLWQGSMSSKNVPIYYHRELKKVFSARRLMYIIVFKRIKFDTELFSTCRFNNCISPDCIDTRNRVRHKNLLQFMRK